MELGIPHTNPILQQLYYNVNASMLPKGIVLYVCVCVCTNGSKEVSFGWDQIYNYLDSWQGWTAYVCEPIVTRLRSVRPDLKEGLVCE